MASGDGSGAGDSFEGAGGAASGGGNGELDAGEGEAEGEEGEAEGEEGAGGKAGILVTTRTTCQPRDKTSMSLLE